MISKRLQPIANKKHILLNSRQLSLPNASTPRRDQGTSSRLSANEPMGERDGQSKDQVLESHLGVRRIPARDYAPPVRQVPSRAALYARTRSAVPGKRRPAADLIRLDAFGPCPLRAFQSPLFMSSSAELPSVRRRAGSLVSFAAARYG